MCIVKKELKQGGISPKASEATPRRIRRKWAGRKPLTVRDASLIFALDALLGPTTRGDPMCPLRWICKSPRNLAEELRRQRHRISCDLNPPPEVEDPEKVLPVQREIK
jgi:hypothetical protein